MIYSFKACGHKNVLAKHKTTIEFTKDKELTLRGDCIVAVNADFSLDGIKKFISSLKSNKIRITIETNDKKIIEDVSATVNPAFNDAHEIVIRKSDFLDKRTFAIKANKSSAELNRGLIGFLKDERNEILVAVLNK